ILSCAPSPTDTYTLSLHDALPIWRAQRLLQLGDRFVEQPHLLERHTQVVMGLEVGLVDVFVDPLLEALQHILEVLLFVARRLLRSEEHTSELQSPYDLVCRLLLEK